MDSSLITLSEAGGFIQQFQQLQQQMKQIQDTLRITQPATSSPDAGSSPPNGTPRTGLSWAEEMDHCDPPGEERSSTSTRVPRKVAEVSERTEQHLTRSFACLDNEDRRKLADSFALPKVAVTKTPELDKIMVAQCSKSTRSND